MRTPRAALLAFLVTLGALVAAGPVSAKVFHSRESALRLAFPGADSLAVQDLILTESETRRVKALSGVRPESRLVSAYVGYASGQVLGWAFLDTHTVRTLPQTLMVVVAPDGTVSATRLLAFHEPPEYQPADTWLRRFTGAELGPALRLGGSVDAVSGSTISARVVTACVRRLLAVWQVKLAPDSGEPLAARLP